MAGNLSTNQAYTAIVSQTISQTWAAGPTINARYAKVGTFIVQATMNATASLYVRMESSIDGTNWATDTIAWPTQTTISGAIVTSMQVDVRDIAAAVFTLSSTASIQVEVRAPYVRFSHKIGSGVTGSSLVSAVAYLGGS